MDRRPTSPLELAFATVERPTFDSRDKSRKLNPAAIRAVLIFVGSRISFAISSFRQNKLFYRNKSNTIMN